MVDVQDPEPVDERPRRNWVVTGIYFGLIGANLWIAYDWWRDTEQGQAWLERAKAKAAACEGCARRKERLAALAARLHGDAIHREAREIIEGGAEVHDEPPAP